MQRHPFVPSESQDGDSSEGPENSHDSSDEAEESDYESEESMKENAEPRELSFAGMMNELGRKRQRGEDQANTCTLKKTGTNTNGESLTSSQMARDDQDSKRVASGQTSQGMPNGQPSHPFTSTMDQSFPMGQPYPSVATGSFNILTPFPTPLPTSNQGLQVKGSSENGTMPAKRVKFNPQTSRKQSSQRANNARSTPQTSNTHATQPSLNSSQNATMNSSQNATGSQANLPWFWNAPIPSLPHRDMSAKDGRPMISTKRNGQPSQMAKDGPLFQNAKDGRSLNSARQNGHPSQMAKAGLPFQNATDTQAARGTPNVLPTQNGSRHSRGASIPNANEPSLPFPPPFLGAPPGMLVMGNGININIGSVIFNMGQWPCRHERRPPT